MFTQRHYCHTIIVIIILIIIIITELHCFTYVSSSIVTLLRCSLCCAGQSVFFRAITRVAYNQSFPDLFLIRSPLPPANHADPPPPPLFSLFPFGQVTEAFVAAYPEAGLTKTAVKARIQAVAEYNTPSKTWAIDAELLEQHGASSHPYTRPSGILRSWGTDAMELTTLDGAYQAWRHRRPRQRIHPPSPRRSPRLRRRRA